jgi:hypothetical protein
VESWAARKREFANRLRGVDVEEDRGADSLGMVWLVWFFSSLVSVSCFSLLFFLFFSLVCLSGLGVVMVG